MPIIGGKGLFFESGIITKFDGNKFTIRDDISRVFITTEIDRSRFVDQKIISEFKVGSRIKIGDGKIFLMPIIKPIQQKGTIQPPIPQAPIRK